MKINFLCRELLFPTRSTLVIFPEFSFWFKKDSLSFRLSSDVVVGNGLSRIDGRTGYLKPELSRTLGCPVDELYLIYVYVMLFTHIPM